MSKVIIKECKGYNVDNLKKQINDAVNLLGGWGKFISPGMKVLLKVNLIGPKTSDTAAVTHAEFVRALAQILKELACLVWIGDSSGGAIAGIAPTAQSFAVSGLEKTAAEEGAVIKNFDKEGTVKITPRSGFTEDMYIAKPMFDADFVIDVPKLKTHSAAIYTGAVKNLFGCIPGLRKAEYHKTAPDPANFGEIIADIHNAVNVGLHIMDAVTAMQGEGPTAGDVYYSNKILISADPLALDTAAVAMIGLKVDYIPILSTAEKRQLGESDLSKIKIFGDYDKIPKLSDFALPKKFGSVKNQNYESVIKIIDFFKTRPKINAKMCRHCNTCADSCPVGAIDKKTKLINYDKCIECLCCHELCLYKAVELKRDNRLADIMMRFYGKKYK